MNLNFKYKDLEIEIQNADGQRIERAMIAAYAFLEDRSISEALESVPVQEEKKDDRALTVNGVKWIKGTPHFQCSYKCTCGNGGRRYVKKDAKDTSCHACNSLLTVFPACEDKEHDEEFNYYVAY